MYEFPTAYVIPVGAGQRSNPEANRLVDWLLFNGIEVRQLRFDETILGQTVEKGSYVVDMAQAHRGLAETALGIGVDVSSRIGILYAPPAAWSHGYLWGADVLQVPNGVPLTAKLTQPISQPTVPGGIALGGGLESGPADYYALEVDSPTAVRTLNTLLKGGLTAKLATAPFTLGRRELPGRNGALRRCDGRRDRTGRIQRRFGVPCGRDGAARSSRTSTARRGSRCSRTPSTRASGRSGTSASRPTRSARRR